MWVRPSQKELFSNFQYCLCIYVYIICSNEGISSNVLNRHPRSRSICLGCSSLVGITESSRKLGPSLPASSFVGGARGSTLMAAVVSSWPLPQIPSVWSLRKGNTTTSVVSSFGGGGWLESVAGWTGDGWSQCHKLCTSDLNSGSRHSSIGFGADGLATEVMVPRIGGRLIPM